MNSAHFLQVMETSPSLDVLFTLDHDAYINEAEIELQTRIGVGSFGEVFKGVWQSTDVAVKRIMETDITREMMKVNLAKYILINTGWRISQVAIHDNA